MARDYMKEGMQWLARVRAGWRTQEVAYKQGESSYTVHASPGISKYEKSTVGGVTIESSMWDFLINADDFPAEFEPEPGDVLTMDDKQYEITNFGDDGCFRYCDPYHTTLRIHTRLLGDMNT